MKLKQYQKEAVDKLLSTTKKLLNKEGSKVCILKAPTGSGKTIMIADFLQKFAEERLQKEYAFVWISSNDLHTQSKEKLELFLADSNYSFSFLEEIQDCCFKQNEIAFVNWHSLVRQKDGEWVNILMADNENDQNLPTFVRNTKAQDREIILIVDESHHHYWSKQSQQLVNDVIAPKLTIEVSATPTIEPEASEMASGDAGYILVEHEVVVNEGMIKSSIIINKEIGVFKDLKETADEAVLGAAIEQRKRLVELYESEGVNIKPLVLVQLPSEAQKTSALDQSKLEAIQTHFSDEFDISVENGRLAIWLSEQKANLENITFNDGDVEVLIFKQAIALGWDCPRAQILVMFREIKNPTFEIQTVGRILRMPEAKHYDTAELNEAFVYTNLGEINIAKDDESQKFFDIHPSHRQTDYEPIDLPSVYLSRIDYGDITLSFRRLFFEEANKRFGITENDLGKDGYDKADKDLELYPDELKNPVISNAIIENIDGANEVIGEMVEFSVPEDELKYKFEIFAKLSSLPYAPVRSHTKIQQAIYDWFDNFLGYKGQSRAEIQRVIVCSDKNQVIFSQIIASAKERFEKLRRTEQNRRQKIKEYKWNVTPVDYFNENYEALGLANSVINPSYLLKKRSKPEKEFESILSGSGNVSWWYKNRESKETYFAIAYQDKKDGALHAFYPDFIVRMKDGSIGIYDTKSGFTADSEETAAKSDVLQKYIQDHKELKLKGGIVISDNTGTFVFIGDKYSHDRTDKGWERLEV